MKCVLAISVLATLLVSSTARVSPGFSDWHRLAKPHNVGDIWKDCSQSGDKAKINTVSITPDPPKKGQDIHLLANVTFSEKITGGKINVELIFDKIPLITLHLDLCDEAPYAGLHCPVNAGPQLLNVTQSIPSEDIPNGAYTGKQTVVDQDGNELFCVLVDFHLE